MYGCIKKHFKSNPVFNQRISSGLNQLNCGQSMGVEDTLRSPLVSPLHTLAIK